MKAMVLLCVLLLCLLTWSTVRNGLPAGEPTYATVDWRDDASAWRLMRSRLMLAACAGEWQVHDYGLWKTAYLPASDLTLIALPGERGHWQRWKR